MQLVKRAEDARLPLKKAGIQRVFRCERCNVVLKDTSSFLAHLDKWHRIHIWYEKGLTRKRVFFDGILSDSSRDEDRTMSIPSKRVPLQARPLRLGTLQKKVLELLTMHPNSTILELGQLLYNKRVISRSTEYNSICRSLHLLENRSLVEKEDSYIKWHVKPKTQ
jgi:uncharacterized C2H2 Zn-finger protein